MAGDGERECLPRGNGNPAELPDVDGGAWGATPASIDQFSWQTNYKLRSGANLGATVHAATRNLYMLVAIRRGGKELAASVPAGAHFSGSWTLSRRRKFPEYRS